MKDFKNFLRQQDLSIATIDRYVRLTEQFIMWFDDDVINCQKKDVLNYLAYLKNHTRQQTITRYNSLTQIPR